MKLSARFIVDHLLSILLMSNVAFAIDYYVDANATAASDSNAGTASAPWKTISKANLTLKPGDKVFIKAGTYSSFIEPTASGTSVSRITYKNFGSDIVTILGASYGVHLNGKSFITVQGINVKQCTHLLFIENGASNNQIFDSSFEQSTQDWDTSVIHTSSQYNHLKNLKFSKGGWCNRAAKDDVGSVLDVGDEYSATDLTRFNLIENCEFFHGGHHVLGLFGDFNTVRNNYFHNEAWSNGYGNRALYTNGADATTGRNVIEGNAFGYSALPCDWDTGNGPSGIAILSTPENIFRYNRVYYGVAYGLGVAAYTLANGFSEGRSNKVFHNTFFANGFDLSRVGTEYQQFNDTVEDAAITVRKSYPKKNVFKSNLFFANRVMVTYSEGADSSANNTQTFLGNYWGETQGNPSFVAANAAPNTIAVGYDFSNQSAPDLHLNATSPAKNLGLALTNVASNDSGIGTALLVADARYFQDGTFAPPGAVQADWIAVGSVSNTVLIVSIPQDTIVVASVAGTVTSLSVAIEDIVVTGQVLLTTKNPTTNIVTSITAPSDGVVQIHTFVGQSVAAGKTLVTIHKNILNLSRSINRKSGDPVWLFKKSDGVQVLYGSAPEPGAYEIQEGGAVPPSAPLNLKVNP